MPIPDYQAIKLPALGVTGDGKLRHLRELYLSLAKTLSVTEEEQAELLPSGKQTRWKNRVNWACYDLYRAGIFSRPKRATYQISDLGRKTLAENPASLNRDYLRQFPHFLEWETGAPKPRGQEISEELPTDTANREPANERLEEAFQELQHALKADLLEQVRSMDPFVFEQVVLDVLVKMGYGGSREEAARVTQKSGDEGIDGVINEDRLGLDAIYVQAKRKQQPIGRPDLQSFVGALVGQRASKGVFITSGEFAGTAYEFVKTIQHKVVLIDGNRLAELMIEFGIGVSEVSRYVIKRVDSDYFETE